MNNNIKKAIVTGGAGFIGSHLVDALLAQGCEVAVLDNLSSGHLSNLEHVRDRIEFYEGDIQDSEILLKASEESDVIFHQAAVVSVPQTVENPVGSAMVNEIGTLQVLDTARKNNVKRVVLASSSAVYGDDPQLPKHENMNPKLLSPYAVQKLTGEYYARLYHNLYGLETVCLRYFNVYGPRQDPSSFYSGVISIFINKAGSKEKPVIYGDGNQSRDFVFVRDVVRANLLAATSGSAAGGFFNVGTGSFIRINQLWDMVCKISGFNAAPEYGPVRPGDIAESVADISHAKSVLGFEPEYSFEKGLGITCDYFMTA
ncbi:MAG: SDR family oxidoreductase [Desulfobacterales bacterium]|nr:SDR family oxidoreductase [Desulfobacterales bacterium]